MYYQCGQKDGCWRCLKQLLNALHSEQKPAAWLIFSACHQDHIQFVAQPTLFSSSGTDFVLIGSAGVSLPRWLCVIAPNCLATELQHVSDLNDCALLDHQCSAFHTHPVLSVLPLRLCLPICCCVYLEQSSGLGSSTASFFAVDWRWSFLLGLEAHSD